MTCNQCGRTAIYQMSGHPLCAEHAAMVSNVQNQRTALLMALMNDAENSIDASFGLATRRPIQIPKSITHTNNTTVNQNTLNIDRSTIGVLNTGTVGTLNSSITTIQQSNPELAGQITSLIEAISSDHKIEQEARKDAIEQISFLLSQASIPTEQRNSSVLKAVLGTVGSILSVSTEIYTLWEAIKPALLSHIS